MNVKLHEAGCVLPIPERPQLCLLLRCPSCWDHNLCHPVPRWHLIASSFSFSLKFWPNDGSFWPLACSSEIILRHLSYSFHIAEWFSNFSAVVLYLPLQLDCKLFGGENGVLYIFAMSHWCVCMYISLFSFLFLTSVIYFPYLKLWIELIKNKLEIHVLKWQTLFTLGYVTSNMYIF